jgi:DHA1 family multidrug resistance protein-like MFS transporter
VAESRRPISWQRNLWSTVIAELVIIIGFQAGFVLIPYYFQELGVHDLKELAAWTGAYQSAGSIGFAVFTPIWGALGDRYGRKLMLVRAMLATVLVMGLTGLVRTPMQLMVLRVIQGCTSGSMSPASALVAISSPKNRLAYGLGLVQTALFAGSSLGPMFGGYIADTFGYRETFLFSAALALIAALLVIVLVREPQESADVAAQARRESPWRGFATLIKSPRVLMLATLTMSIGLTYGLLGPVVPLFVQELVGDRERLASTAGMVSGVAAFSAAIAAVVIGRLSDRIGHRRALLGCTLGMALLYIPQAFVRSASSLTLLRGVQGFFQGGISPSTSAMVVSGISREKTGAALGLNSSASSAGQALGPLLGALLLTATSARTMLLIAAGMFGVVSLSVAIGSTLYPLVQGESARRV